MNEAIRTYLTNSDRFGDLVDRIDESGWAAASPCAGWTAADVLDHVLETQRDFLRQRGAELGAGAAGSPAERWRDHQRRVRELLLDEEFATTPYDGFFGPTTVAETLRDFYGWDLIVHRWDIGRAAGISVIWDEEEVAQAGGQLEGFGEMLYSEGICKPALPAPADADEQTRILALLGRRD